MSAQQDFLRYLGVAGATIALCFGAQEWFGSCLDIHWHAQLRERPANAALIEVRAKEDRALHEAGIEKAMAQVAASRTGDARIAPTPSKDLSAMSGWVQQPNFTPYEPQVVQLPSATSAGAEAGTQ
jgi:hypothetical protein